MYFKEISDNDILRDRILVTINATEYSSSNLCMILPEETFDKIYRLIVHLIFALQGNRKYVAQNIKVFNISLLIGCWHVSPFKLSRVYMFMWRIWLCTFELTGVDGIVSFYALTVSVWHCICGIAIKILFGTGLTPYTHTTPRMNLYEGPDGGFPIPVPA